MMLAAGATIYTPASTASDDEDLSKVNPSQWLERQTTRTIELIPVKELELEAANLRARFGSPPVVVHYDLRKTI